MDGSGIYHGIVQNYQGSVIALTDTNGNVQSSFIYGSYGEPKNAIGQSSWTGSRFMYTGQMAIPEAQLYYYRARVYDPMYGRFLQTDPIGSKDDLDLYAYTAGDPINGADPTGTMFDGGGSTVYTYDPDGFGDVGGSGSDAATMPPETPVGRAFDDAIDDAGAKAAQEDGAIAGQPNADAPEDPFEPTPNQPYRPTAVRQGGVGVNKGQQMKHTVGTNNYKQELARGVQKSILWSDDPQGLLNDYAGTGEQRGPIKVGLPGSKEYVNFHQIIGEVVSLDGKAAALTNYGMIMYDAKGTAHIVPWSPNVSVPGATQ